MLSYHYIIRKILIIQLMVKNSTKWHIELFTLNVRSFDYFYFPSQYQYDRPILINTVMLLSTASLLIVLSDGYNRDTVHPTSRELLQLWSTEPRWKAFSWPIWACGLGCLRAAAMAGLAGQCNGPHLFTLGQRALTADERSEIRWSDD